MKKTINYQPKLDFNTKKHSFNVYGTPFNIDSKYSLITALGRGSYGIVWYICVEFLLI